jgi:hypothetical protein
MQEAGRRRVDAPDFVASVRMGRGKIIITDANKVPEEFIKTERTVKLKDIAAALKDGRKDIPGITTSNGQPYLDVRQ